MPVKYPLHPRGLNEWREMVAATPLDCLNEQVVEVLFRMIGVVEKSLVSAYLWRGR